MSVAAMKESSIMNKKIINISSKRQITIPQQFYSMLGFADEAECMVRNGELVIRPVRINTGGEFAEQILKDLLDQGLSGEELLTAFKATQAKVRPAVESMIAEAESVAMGKGEYSTYDEIFAAEEDS